MAQDFRQLWLVGTLAMGGVLASGGCALAQIIPDGTLGTESSIVTPTNVNGILSNQIDGGATRGGNLFHSFEQFSIPTGEEARFNNALGIQNIISRVTGVSVSNIDGWLRANGTANVFLLNPNGIIFGPNAKLNIGGSFVASTASSLNFADGTSFSAIAPTTTPVLTISVPMGLQYGANLGRIQVQGDGQGTRTTTAPIDTTVGLRVQPNQTLAIVGGDVALLGGTLKTAGGRIELGSVAGPGLVNLTSIDSGWALGYEGVSTFADIQLSGAATVDASGAGGGDITVLGRRVTLTNGSQIEASTLGAEPGGTLSVTAKESVELSGESADRQYPSALAAQAYSGATGNGGNLTVKTGQLTVRDGAQVLASNLSVSASDTVELIGRSANDLGRSGLIAWRFGDGNAGNLTIATGRLTVRDGAWVETRNFGTGAGGTLSVTATDVVELIGTSARSSPSSLIARTFGEGNAGNLTIATERLTVQGGAQVSAGTFGTGAGGRLSVTATDVVELIGESANSGLPTRLSTETFGEGNAGDLTIATGRLTVQGGAQVLTVTWATGAGGRLSVSATDVVELIGRSIDGQLGSNLSAQTQHGGNAGDLTIATGRLTVRDGGVVAVNSRGSGNAGSLRVAASSLLLENKGKLLASIISGDGGNIDLQVQDLLLMRASSLISAEAEGTGNGGNITINAPFIVAVPAENSDIFANAIQGRGGNINITTQGIYGLEYRSNLTSESDINASSEFGVSGTVEINNPDVDPNQGLVELPTELVDAANQIATACAAGGESKFIITGRGGLPPNPRQVLSTDAMQVDWVELDASREHRSIATPSTNSTKESASTTIVEANGWKINNKDEVVLTATVPTATLGIPWVPSSNCHTPEPKS